MSGWQPGARGSHLSWVHVPSNGGRGQPRGQQDECASGELDSAEALAEQHDRTRRCRQRHEREHNPATPAETRSIAERKSRTGTTLANTPTARAASKVTCADVAEKMAWWPAAAAATSGRPIAAATSIWIALSDSASRPGATRWARTP